MWRRIYNRTEWTAMNSDKSRAPSSSVKAAAEAVRGLIATARKGALASLMKTTGAPYASLVNVASENGMPVLLLSRLAWHTQNILADNRSCLLISKGEESKDPLTQPRASLLGRLEIADSDSVRDVYFRLHPTARSYSQFGDFSFFRLNIETAHYVAGFGQIITLEQPQLFEAGR
jgi:putative heme iron utilization protein